MELNKAADITNLLNQKKKYLTNVLPTAYDSSLQNIVTRNENHYYLQFNFNNSTQLPHQGFKIHVSGTLKNYQNILDIVFNFCQSRKLNFKYISNSNNIIANLSGHGTVWSSGKFITIYPSNLNEFKKSIAALYKLSSLKKLSGIDIVSDRRFKDSNVIYYRYGVIVGPDKTIYNPQNKEDKYEDYTKILYYLPSWIEEPFPVNVDDGKKSSKLFKKYIPLKAVNNKPSGSTFVVRDQENNKLILKNAKYGYMDESGTTQIQLLKKEMDNLKRLNSYTFLPTYIDNFKEDEDFFLVESFMPGENVDAFRADTRNSFISSEKRMKTIVRYKKIVMNLLIKIHTLHKDNIFLGDISSGNVLIDMKENVVNFIDLAQSRLIKKVDKHYFFYRTAGFFDENTPYLSFLEQDKQQLGYLIIAMFTRANMFLKIDTSGKMSFNFFEKYIKTYNIPRIYIYLVKSLLFSPSISLSTLIKRLAEDDEFQPILTLENETCNVSSILNRLQNAVNTAILDNLQFDRLKVKIKCTDYIFSDSISNIRYKYLLNKRVVLKPSIKNHLFKELLRFDLLLKNNSKINLSNVISLLVCCIKNMESLTQQNEIEKVIQDVIENYKVIKNSKLLGYRMINTSSYLSPYIDDGMAGFLLVLLIYRDKTESDVYDLEIYQIINNLKKAIMPKSGGFSNGLSGIIFSLSLYQKAFQDNKIKKYIRIMVNRLPLYCICSNNNAYLVTSAFNSISLELKDGNMGVIDVLANFVQE